MFMACLYTNFLMPAHIILWLQPSNININIHFFRPSLFLSKLIYYCRSRISNLQYRHVSIPYTMELEQNKTGTDFTT